MVNLSRIYTRTGDAGKTRLGGGEEVAQTHSRVQAYGDVAERSSVLGLASTAESMSRRHLEILRWVQNDLFDLGADLALREEDKTASGACGIEPGQVERLERGIDTLGEELGPLEEFILPGGSPGAAVLHLARTVCRRAERVVVALSKEEAIGGLVIPYLNRLSDLLFMLARRQNRAEGRGV